MVKVFPHVYVLLDVGDKVDFGRCARTAKTEEGVLGVQAQSKLALREP